MKEHPILFSGPGVGDILEDRKSQTRRVIKPQPSMLNGSYQFMNGLWWPTTPSGKIGIEQPVKCPYGQPGDRLWVKETGWWSKMKSSDGRDAIGTAYKATFKGDKAPSLNGKWTPSRYMPRWASRITLEITDIRVERVQEISTTDIWAEGVDNGRTNPKMGERHDNMQHIAFSNLWDSINAKRGFGWDVNPWVWIIEFKRIDNGD